MKIIRAQHLGMCFGVRDAITLAQGTARTKPLTILGELVHNDAVLSDLRSSGIQIEQNIENVTTQAAMVTAHGASRTALLRARERGLHVIEATCPLVHFAHRAVTELIRDGFHPVIVGRRDHVEVRGITEDLEAYDVVLNTADIEQVHHRPRFGVVAQTTQPLPHVRAMADALRKRFPQSEVRLIDTVCQPTKQRQTAAVEMARASDVVIVVGGANSNNTHQLVATCRTHCARVHHVQCAGQLRREWFENLDTVGLTAGTSTPDSLIDAVEHHIRTMASACENNGTAAENGLNSGPESTKLAERRRLPSRLQHNFRPAHAGCQPQTGKNSAGTSERAPNPKAVFS
jgi:4-hydroxy-3-methylbut-2-en-1-yl diphosphate reductase